MSRVSPTPTDADATLPPPPAAAETLAPSASSPVAAGAPTVPGYELLRELGRGGMGVVYQARDLKLNRVVALKMILAGGHASAAEMVRFLAEAEAVAALQHPHIVAIYEVGRHDNLPYFTLEFCPGGSLADRVKDAPLSPQAAAHVVEQVARGVAFAHGRGIVHRDLKPENVLFADDGTPKITDFGLAKRLATGAGLTATGAVLGTPSYMAPEQAAGRKEVGPAADVYALGAILYRLLAGRPPFQAATALDTVMQVVSEEAVPLRRLNGQVPRDLETICQKCLHKDARKRYATAEALADDLRRFQESEPIAARPIGLLERGVKWTRRHPARAAFINSLMLGLVISTGLAIQATTNADRARRNEADANTARRDLEAANTDLSRQREDLSTSRDKLEQSLASSMLRPFRVEPGPLTESEIEALRELARSEGGGLRVRFVREAVKSPSATHQLANRAAVALHSAVGLDQTRREAIERALAGRLDGSTPAAERFDIALALARLGDLSPDVHQRAVKELLESKSAHMDANTSGATAAALIALANRRPPADAAAILLKALGQTPHPAAVHELAAAVAAHAARLEPAIAAPIAAQAVAAVIAALEKTTGYSSENPLLFEAFTLLAALLGPQDARAIVEQTVAKLTRPAAQNERRGIMVNVDPQQIPLAPVLSRLAPVEAPDCCLKAANALMAALSNKENDTSQMEAQLNALHALAAHLPPSGAWAVRVKTAEVMTQSLLEPPSLMSGLRPWAMNSSMSKLASEFGPPEAATVCRQILAGLPRIFAEVNTSLGKNSDDFSPEGIQRNLARVKLFGAMDALATLANRLDSKDAADIGPSAAALLDKALKKNPQDPLAMMALQRGRVLATVHLKFAKRSAELTRDFVAATDDLTVAALADALSASADQLTPADAAAVCDHLMSKLSTYVIKNTDISAQLGMGSTSALGELLKAFQVVSARLAPQAASAVSARAAKILMEALASEPGEKNAVAIAQGLENLADRLSAPDAATVAVQLQWSLDKALRGQLKSDFGAIVPLARALAALAPVSKSAISRVATQSIGLRINNESDPMRVGRLAEATAVLASGLEPNDAAHRCSAAAHAVRRAIEKNTSDVNTAVLVVHLGELARWTDPQQACPLLLEALSRAPQSRLSSPNMKSFAQALVGVDAPARQRRTAAVAGVIGGTGPLAALAALPVAAQPLPCRLDTPALVELLKHPLCVGEPRRAVLDQIELRYGRKFVDVWEFVEFANQQGLKLDFTRPPKGLAAQ